MNRRLVRNVALVAVLAGCVSFGLRFGFGAALGYIYALIVIETMP